MAVEKTDELAFDNYEGSLEMAEAQDASKPGTASVSATAYVAIACAALAIGLLSTKTKLGRVLVVWAPVCLIAGVCELMNLPIAKDRSADCNRGYDS